MPGIDPKVKAQLAYVHATGCRPQKIHHHTERSRIFWLSIDAKDAKWIVKSEMLPHIEDHPFVVNVKKFERMGFFQAKEPFVRHLRTIRRGIPMHKPETQQTIYVMSDGKVQQTFAPGGKFEFKENILGK